MKHILVMSGTGSIGLMALFLVDLVDMLFISMLGQIELAAAIGFAGTLIFFSTSVSIGSSISMGALVSKALGAKQHDYARQIAGSTLSVAFFNSLIVTGVMYAFIPELLSLIGAEGLPAERAEAYLRILLPSSPLIALGMAAGAGLRAVGDAKRSMWATLSGGIVNAILDPLFIFGFGWNIEGAALASVFARFTVLSFSLYPLVAKHNLVAVPKWAQLRRDVAAIFAIALPAIITNTATPVGNAIVTSSIAQFGEDFVAGFAVIGRLTPVAFAVIFALSGNIGPIIGQNFGAERFDRVKETLNNALIFVTVYCISVSLIMYLLQDIIIASFNLTGDAATIVAAFCTVVAITFVFNGALFVANASFNNLGKPFNSTMLNLGKATLGTLPFVYLGSLWFGALGVLYGQALGSILFGVIGVIMLRKYIVQLGSHAVIEPEEELAPASINMVPFCSDCVETEEIPVSPVENQEISEPVK